MGLTTIGNEELRPFYEGATLHIRSYDSINNDARPVIRGDAPFYRDLTRRSGGEVLEIGVGTGRVALQLVESGLQVTGLDASALRLLCLRSQRRRQAPRA